MAGLSGAQWPSSTRCCASSSGAAALLADEVGIEQLIDRLEELDEELVWDA
jgi:hypothetical protein